MALTDLTGFIWMDGQWIDWQQAQVPIYTHGLHYGTGVFEGVRAYATPRGPAIYRLAAHTDRLYRSADIIGLTIPYSKDVLQQAQIDVIKKNQFKSAYIRPLIYLGAEQLGLHVDKVTVHAAVMAWEWGAYLGEDSKTKGLKVCTSSYQRHHVNSMMSKAKATGNYLNSMLAAKEAHRHGCQEAVLLDNQGYVAEGSGENIFIVRDNQLMTPDTGAILQGITRASIITLAQGMNISVIEKRLTRDDVYTADEAFFTGTAVEIAPIVDYDGHQIGDGKPGKLTKQLQQAYFALVNGQSHPQHEWLTYCI